MVWELKTMKFKYFHTPISAQLRQFYTVVSDISDVYDRRNRVGYHTKHDVLSLKRRLSVFSLFLS